jgi:hypothetical protein
MSAMDFTVRRAADIQPPCLHGTKTKGEGYISMRALVTLSDSSPLGSSQIPHIAARSIAFMRWNWQYDPSCGLQYSLAKHFNMVLFR